MLGVRSGLGAVNFSRVLSVASVLNHPYSPYEWAYDCPTIVACDVGIPSSLRVLTYKTVTKLSVQVSGADAAAPTLRRQRTAEWQSADFNLTARLALPELSPWCPVPFLAGSSCRRNGSFMGRPAGAERAR